MFLRKNIPDTLRPQFDEQINVPDYMNWDKYKNTGFLQMYSIISEAIIRNRSPDPSKNASSIDVAYMPMKTPEYENIPPIATDQLS